MKQPGDSELHELLWRSKLTPAERSRLQQLLAAEPDRQMEAAEEEKLNQMLAALPEPRVSSNFTARVMQAVELENLQVSREKRDWPAWRVGFGWVSRLAMAGCILAAGVFTFQKHQSRQHTELAQSISNLSNVSAFPAEWAQDFDTIRNLSSASPVDDELLTALK